MTNTAMIRVSAQTHKALAELSQLTGSPIAELTAVAVERYRRAFLFEQANADYAAMRADPVAAAEFDTEHERWSRLPDALEGL